MVDFMLREKIGALGGAVWGRISKVRYASYLTGIAKIPSSRSRPATLDQAGLSLEYPRKIDPYVRGCVIACVRKGRLIVNILFKEISYRPKEFCL